MRIFVKNFLKQVQSSFSFDQIVLSVNQFICKGKLINPQACACETMICDML